VRTITLEEHVTTSALLEATAGGFFGHPSQGYMEKMRSKLLDLAGGRIADMDATGIDMQVLSLAGGGLDKVEASTATFLARDTNDTLVFAVRAHPDRFAAFATLALQQPETAAVELERCVQQLQFKGTLINGTMNGMFLDHASFTPVLECAQALDVPIYLHPAPPPPAVQAAYYEGLSGPVAFLLSTAAWGWHVETGMHCLRLIVSGVFDRFPRLKVIVGHMGEDLPYSIVRADSVPSRNVKHLQGPVIDYFHEHFYITTSGYFSTPPFLCALQVVGADRILFSVDYPFSSNRLGRDFLDALPVSPEDFEKITHRNAERLLRL
jgi:predicted TIM-barrel fold metal-dependent hydrolase